MAIESVFDQLELVLVSIDDSNQHEGKLTRDELSIVDGLKAGSKGVGYCLL